MTVSRRVRSQFPTTEGGESRPQSGSRTPSARRTTADPIGHHRREVARSEHELDTFGADAQRLQHATDDGAEALHLERDVVNLRGIARIGAALGPSLQALGLELEGREWRAQFVGGEGEQVVAGADRLARELVEAGILERGRDAGDDALGEREVVRTVASLGGQEGHRAEGFTRHHERDRDPGPHPGPHGGCLQRGQLVMLLEEQRGNLGDDHGQPLPDCDGCRVLAIGSEAARKVSRMPPSLLGSTCFKATQSSSPSG